MISKYKLNICVMKNYNLNPRKKIQPPGPFMNFSVPFKFYNL